MKKIFLCILALMLAVSLFCTSILVSALQADKSNLEALVAQAKTLQMEDYNVSNVVWQRFQLAIQDAEVILNDSSVSQTEVDYMFEELAMKMGDLGSPNVVQPESVDRSRLEALVQEVSSWKMEDYDVSADEWSRFQEEIAGAQRALTVENVTQEAMDEASKYFAGIVESMAQRKKSEVASENESNLSNESKVDESNTEKATKEASTKSETRPKSTTPFLQGGFIELGCDASIAISTLAIVGIVGSALVIKKKHD
jgi:hypothetical protein